MSFKNKIFFAVETSCDDTCVGIINATYSEFSRCIKWSVLANVKVTQKYDGGVIPEVAARLHLNELKKCCDRAFEESGITVKDVDVICATATPGLIGSVFVGYNFALSLSISNNKTFIPIHHLEGHMFVCFNEVEFAPFIAIIASGGHSQIVVCKTFGQYEIVCKTTDDAIGEVLDKVGRELHCSFPAGPEIEKLAKFSQNSSINMKLPCAGKLEWSFSGIKSNCLRLIEAGHAREDVAYALQNVICGSIFEKLTMVLKIHKIDNIIFCGGVSANEYLRHRLSDFKVKYANLCYCTDNGVMIAVAGANHYFNESNKVNNYWNIGQYVDLCDWHSI